MVEKDRKLTKYKIYKDPSQGGLAIHTNNASKRRKSFYDNTPMYNAQENGREILQRE